MELFNRVALCLDVVIVDAGGQMRITLKNGRLVAVPAWTEHSSSTFVARSEIIAVTATL